LKIKGDISTHFVRLAGRVTSRPQRAIQEPNAGLKPGATTAEKNRRVIPHSGTTLRYQAQRSMVTRAAPVSMAAAA